jgi:tetratricopeptide (TPR) repeat protein
MDDLTGNDLYSLRAAQGWAELGNFTEANAELESITATLRTHPDALQVRWHICAHVKNFAACVDIAEAIIKQAPDLAEAWIHRSFALHELNRTQEAFELLLPAAKKFPKVWTIPYNLACYCSQLLRVDEAREWFKKAMAIDEKAAKESALEDPDLKPLWDSMDGTIWKRE